jgi:hypothetical protein
VSNPFPNTFIDAGQQWGGEPQLPAGTELWVSSLVRLPRAVTAHAGHDTVSRRASNTGMILFHENIVGAARNIVPDRILDG